MLLFAFALRLAVFRLDPVEAVRLDPDGTWTLAVASRDPGEISQITRYDIHPPGLYWFVHLWLELVGSSTFAAVSLFMLIGVMAIAAAFSAGVALGGRRAGLGTAFLVAILAPVVLQAQTVRYIPLSFLLGLLLVYAVVRGASPPAAPGHLPRPPNLALFGFALIAGLHTLYLFIGLAIPALLLAWPGGMRVFRRFAAVLLLCASSLLLWLVPAAPLWLDALSTTPSSLHLPPLREFGLTVVRLGLGGEFWPGHPEVPALALLLLTAGAMLGLGAAHIGGPHRALAWGTAMAAAVLALYVTGGVARGQNEAVNPRYLIIILPLALPLLGLLLARCWRRPWVGVSVTAGAVGLAVTGLAGFLTRAAPDPQLWDPLPLVRLLQEEAQEDDLVVFDSLGQAGHYVRLTPQPVPWTYVTGPDLYFHEKLPEPSPAHLNWPASVRTVWVVLYRGGGRHSQALLREMEDRAYPAQRMWLGDSLVSRLSLPRQPVRHQAGGARFANGIELAAACWPAEPVTGGSINLELIWRRGEGDAGNYKVFVHAVASTGEVVAQHDAPLENDRGPTSSWPASELARDFHGLPLPAEASAEEFVLDVGLYDGRGRERLLDGSDRVTLGPIQIEERSRPPAPRLFPLLMGLGRDGPAPLPIRGMCAFGYVQLPSRGGD